MSVKLTVELPDDVVGAIRDYAKQRNIDMTEALTEMIRSHHALASEVLQGGKVLLEKPDRTFREFDLNATPSKGR